MRRLFSTRSFTFSRWICTLNLYFVQKLLWKEEVARGCLSREKLLQTPKVIQKLTNTIVKGLSRNGIVPSVLMPSNQNPIRSYRSWFMLLTGTPFLQLGIYMRYRIYNKQFSDSLLPQSQHNKSGCTAFHIQNYFVWKTTNMQAGDISTWKTRFETVGNAIGEWPILIKLLKKKSWTLKVIMLLSNEVFVLGRVCNSLLFKE